MMLYLYLLVILPTPFIVHKWLPVKWNALSAAVHNIKLPSDQSLARVMWILPWFPVGFHECGMNNMHSTVGMQGRIYSTREYCNNGKILRLLSQVRVISLSVWMIS